MNRLLFAHSTFSVFNSAFLFQSNRPFGLYKYEHFLKSSRFNRNVWQWRVQLPFRFGCLVSMCVPYEHRHRTKSAMCCDIRKCIASSVRMAASAQCGWMLGETYSAFQLGDASIRNVLHHGTEWTDNFSWKTSTVLFTMLPNRHFSAQCACVRRTKFSSGEKSKTGMLAWNSFHRTENQSRSIVLTGTCQLRQKVIIRIVASSLSEKLIKMQGIK